MNHDDEALKNFMAGYFHEDWPDCDGSPEEVVRHYFREQDSIEELSSVLRALRELINGGGDDDEAPSDRLFDGIRLLLLSARRWSFDARVAAVGGG